MNAPPEDFTDAQRRWLREFAATLDREIRISTVESYYNGAVTAGLAGVLTLLAFDSDEIANAYMHDTATNNSRLYAPEAGVYDIRASVLMDQAAAGACYIQLFKNGVFVRHLNYNYQATAGQFYTLNGGYAISLAAGDYLEIKAGSAAAYNVYGNGTSPRCTLARMRLLPI